MLRPILTVSCAPARPGASGTSMAAAASATNELRMISPPWRQAPRAAFFGAVIGWAQPITSLVRVGHPEKPPAHGRPPAAPSALAQHGLEEVERRRRERLH